MKHISNLIISLISLSLLVLLINGCACCKVESRQSETSRKESRAQNSDTKPVVAMDTTHASVSLDTTSPGSITLKWRTESEEDNYGFNLYRSLSKEGPWEKVNDKIVPGNGTTSEPHDYKFVDSSVKKNTTYYYQLEEVDFGGNPKRMPYTIKGLDNKPSKKDETSK